jgi:hypothetical protein
MMTRSSVDSPGDAELEEAKQQINEAKSFNMATPQVAAMLDTLNDFESPSE